MSADADNRGEARTGALLEVTGLECRRGERPLFSPLAFSARSGDIVWVRGANGQGKTTLLRTIAGLSAPAAGRVVRADAHGRPLYLAHANALKDDLTVAESLRFLLALDGHAAGDDRADDALERFGLRARRYSPVRTLSQGQRRRVALARLAACNRPSLWLLDEPFDALDAGGIEALDAVLVAHAQRGGAVVLTSHQPLTITSPAPIIVQLAAA